MKISNSIPLPGLREDNPRDLLAALGLLRLVDGVFPNARAALAWESDPAHPVLSSDDGLPDDWLARCVEAIRHLAAMDDSPLFHGDVIKTSPEEFRTAILRADAYHSEGRPLPDLPGQLYAAYSGQAVDEKTGGLQVSGLSFANGQGNKKLLKDARDLLRELDADHMLACLEGRHAPADGKSLRWNPAEYRPAAHRGHDPGAGVRGDAHLDHPSLNALAFLGLSFYPTVATRAGSGTTGLHRRDRVTRFVWPAWSKPLRPDTVSCLLHMDPQNARSRPDVMRVWASKRFTADKSTYFAPAVRMP